MASLLTKVRRSVRRQLHALTVRRCYDREMGGVYFDVRASHGGRRMHTLGTCGRHVRDEVLHLCVEHGYSIDEIVEGRTWICRLDATKAAR